MVDRKLLELAAKAYWRDEIDDVVSVEWSETDQAIAYTHGDNQDHNGLDVTLLWIPLDDDGEALRLAAKLGISITHYPVYTMSKHSLIAKQYRPSDMLREANQTEIIELYGDDKCAAMRRAIVSCAAAIGEMK